MKIILNSKINLLKNKIRERNISKYFQVHNKWTYKTDADMQLNNMREPIANFAKKNNLTIDVYNPEQLEQKFKSDIKFDNLDELSSPHIGIVVKNKKTGKIAAAVVDADTNKIYPKETTTIHMIPIKGEQNLQISREVKSTREDSFLQHVFRTIENLQRACK